MLHIDLQYAQYWKRAWMCAHVLRNCAAIRQILISLLIITSDIKIYYQYVAPHPSAIFQSVSNDWKAWYFWLIQRRQGRLGSSCLWTSWYHYLTNDCFLTDGQRNVVVVCCCYVFQQLIHRFTLTLTSQTEERFQNRISVNNNNVCYC